MDNVRTMFLPLVMFTRQGRMLRLFSFRGASKVNLLLLDGARLTVPPCLYTLCCDAADYLPETGKPVVSIFKSNPLV